MSLPPLTIEEAKTLAAGPLARTILEAVASYTVPLSWVRSFDGREQHLSNGTAFFLQTAKGVFGVTANHVVAGYQAAKQSNPRTVCHLLDREIDIEAALIDRGRSTDIATFKVSEKLIADLKKHPATGWPPMMPTVGKGIVYAGFPGYERRLLRPREFSFGLYVGGGLAHSVDRDKITSSPVSPADLVDTMGLGLPSENYDIGGMSGGPVFTLVETGLVSWRLAGVISQGMRFGTVFYVSRGDNIEADGSIKP